MKVTLVFDIGKTNKKCLLFDEKLQEVHVDTMRFEEVTDGEGFPCDDLPTIVSWIRKTFDALRKDPAYEIEALNFSTYGASLVHIDKEGCPLLPLVNYLKPYPEAILAGFLEKYGGEEEFAQRTASPVSGMLNSGLQLYWLKQAQPALFEKIHYSLHFPQYLSYLFSGMAVSDYTSLGCHTGLWDYEKQDYHDWVYEENMDKILAPIVPTHTVARQAHKGRLLKVGVGIHDSSAALYPYLKAGEKPFVLLSTGTWSVALNPFGSQVLTREELAHGCLNYLQLDGRAVKSARLFLGNEHALQVEKLARHFGRTPDAAQQLRFDEEIWQNLKKEGRNRFRFESLPARPDEPVQPGLDSFESFEEAYHQLVHELVALQAESVRRITGEGPPRRIYLEGGFAHNEIFIHLMKHQFPKTRVKVARHPVGAALGAAMAISAQKLERKRLKKRMWK